MRPVRAVVLAAVVAGTVATGGAAVMAAPAPPGTDCIDPTTAPATAEPVSTLPAVPTTQAAGAVVFTPPEGDFSVTFPGQPEPQTVPGTGAETSTWGVIDGTAGYLVSRTLVGAGQSIDLQGGCEGAVAGMGGTLISSVAITVDGRPGIEFVASVQGGTAVQRIIDAGTAMYQLVATDAGTLTAADPIVVAFFDSFHLTAAIDPAATTLPAVPTVAVPTIPVPTVAVPTVAVPTVAVPTVAAPTVAVPTIAVPTIAVPTVAVPTVAGSTTAPVPAGWTLYTSPTDGYSVAFPTEPTTSSQPMPTGDGGSLPLSTTRASGGDREFAVNYFALPAGGTFDAEAGRDGSLGDFSATLVSSVPIELAGRTGLEFVGSFIQDGQPATVVSRIYTDGSNVHQLLALSFGTVDATDPEIAGFFGTFTFTGATTPLRSPATQAAAGRSLAGARSLALEPTIP